MFEEKVQVFRVTVKKIMERLSTIENCDVDNFQETVTEQFDGYDYEDIEDLIGFDSWGDISENGKYELTIKINHPNAYEFNLFVNVQDRKATIINIL